MIVSGTITDASGRTLSGQTLEAFWTSVRHADPLLVGLNCALGPRQLREHVEELSRLADVAVVGVPQRRAAQRARRLRRDARADGRGAGRVGARRACSTSWARAAGPRPSTRPRSRRPWPGVPPRVVAGRGTPPPTSRASSRSSIPMPDGLFVNVGERTNVTGLAPVRAADGEAAADGGVHEGEDEAVAIARDQVENGAVMLDVNMDEAMLDGVAAMTRFLRRLGSEPDIAAVPVMVDSSKWSVIEAGLQQLQGEAS